MRELEALSDAELRAQLGDADPVARLHAAWALALRGAPSDVVARARVDPSAGVRGQLIVILTGAREVGALEAIARNDESAMVAARACIALARLAVSDPEIDTLAAEVFGGSRHEVQERVVEEADPSGAPRLAVAMGHAISNANAAVRAAVVARIEAGGSIAELPIADAALLRAALAEPQVGLRLAMAKLAIRRGLPVARALDVETLAALVSASFGADQRLPPALLDPVVSRWLAGEHALLDDVRAHRLVGAHFDELPISALLHLIEAHDGVTARWEDLAERCLAEPLAPADREAARRIATGLRAYVAWAREPDDEPAWCDAILRAASALDALRP